MSIDWTLVARYLAPIAALFVGALLNRLIERRGKLISYLAHASAIGIQPPEGDAFNVYTHSVVVRNAGRKSAQNVRLGHHYLSNFSVYPSVPYEIAELPGGGKELLFPTMVPGEQITVAYLYYPPVLWSNINSYTKSDEGFAKIVKILPTPQPAPWLRRLTTFLALIGVATLLYGVTRLTIWLGI